jgi:hypothetical protein
LRRESSIGGPIAVTCESVHENGWIERYGFESYAPAKMRSD